MSGDLNMVNNKITNLLNPTSNQEAATKNYVDNVLYGPNLFISTNAGNTSLAGIYNRIRNNSIKKSNIWNSKYDNWLRCKIKY